MNWAEIIVFAITMSTAQIGEAWRGCDWYTLEENKQKCEQRELDKAKTKSSKE